LGIANNIETNYPTFTTDQDAALDLDEYGLKTGDRIFI